MYFFLSVASDVGHGKAAMFFRACDEIKSVLEDS